ncbi:MAG: hypothetical protein KF703_19490 [Actinobacteria bacterium]|nr:hypothetical protein [Actinomycetota bacterium]
MTGGSARARVLLLALGWGELIGAIAGAVAGTAIAPVLGTVYGALVGALVAVVPSVAGAIALWLAARPGTSPEAFRRRSATILTVVGATIGVVVGWASSTGEWDEQVAGPVVAGCLVAIALLVRAQRSIGGVEPDPVGAPRGPERAALALLLAVVFGALGWFGWHRYLSPGARARREVVGERDRLGRLMGLGDLYGYDLDRGARRIECRWSGAEGDATTTGYLSYGGGSQEYGDIADARDAVDRARRDLEARGYRVAHEERPQGSWVYGLRRDRSVTIEGPGTRPLAVDLPDETGIDIRVADGCPDRQPPLSLADGDAPPRLLAAGHAPAVADRPVECSDGRPAALVTVVAAGWLGRAADRADAWTLTTASGRAVRPCELPGAEDPGAVHALLVPRPDDPVVRAEVAVEVVTGEGQNDAEAATTRLSVDVAPPGAPARAVRASLDAAAGDLREIYLGDCPAGTVQGVLVRWDRPRLQANDVDDETARTAAPERDYRVSIERDGRTRTVAPLAVEGVSLSSSGLIDATGQLLCLGEPGRPVRVRGAASEQLDLGGPPTEAFDLAIPRP